MKIRYKGPASEVSLAPAAGGITFRHGEIVEIDDTLARDLLAQGTFEKAEPVRPAGRGSAAASQRDIETR